MPSFGGGHSDDGARHGYAGGFSESGFDSSIAVWDGKAESLRDFRKLVSWWVSSIDLTKTANFNLAARFDMKQKGSARLRALEFEPADLEYRPAKTQQDPDTEEELVLVEADYTRDIYKILDAWEEMVGRTLTDRRGELRERFYLHLRRPAHESLSNFALRYRTLLAELMSEGVVVDDAEAAWFYKNKLGLSEIQKQLLETTLGTNADVYADCERESLRLFKRMHNTGPQAHPRRPGFGTKPFFNNSRFSKTSSDSRSTAPSSSTTSTFGKFRRSFGGHHSTNVAENADEDWYGDYDETEAEVMDVEGADDYGGHPGEAIEAMEVLQSEVEVLASELEEAAADESLQTLAELEGQLEQAVEALVTMREAKTRLAGGFKGPDRKGAGRGTGKGPYKKNSQCRACYQYGHWAGDPECAKGGKSKDGKGKKGAGRLTKALNFKGQPDVKETNIVDLMPAISETEVMMSSVENISEVMMAERLSEVLAARDDRQLLNPEKSYQAAVDSACNRSCAGEIWVQRYQDALQRAPQAIKSLVQVEQGEESFRFGNGGVLRSSRRIRLPMIIGSAVVCVWLSIIPCGFLGCLLGKDFLEAMGALVNFVSNRMTLQLLPDKPVLRLGQMKAGHASLNPLPTKLSDWPPLGGQKWCRLGRAGICEVQSLSKMNWWISRLKSLVFDHGGRAENYVSECEPSEIKPQVDNPDGSYGTRGTRTSRRSMGALHPQAGQAKPMALAGRVALALAATWSSLPANSVSFDNRGERMAAPGGRYGAEGFVAETRGDSGGAKIQWGHAQCDNLSAKPYGHGSFLHGRRDGDGRFENDLAENYGGKR